MTQCILVDKCQFLGGFYICCTAPIAVTGNRVSFVTYFINYRSDFLQICVLLTLLCLFSFLNIGHNWMCLRCACVYRLQIKGRMQHLALEHAFPFPEVGTDRLSRNIGNQIST
jgi:hypothetical protein